MKSQWLLPLLVLYVSCLSVSTIGSTIPANGDVNPYGVAVAFQTVGVLTRGDVLVSNFNNANNFQGMGTTIVQFHGVNQTSLFAEINPAHVHCPGGIGLTTALVILHGGWVIVGSLPTLNGTFTGRGCLIILNSFGHVVNTIVNDLINGPWDATVVESGQYAYLFVTNVLNGGVTQGPSHVVNEGTVIRITLDTSCRHYNYPIVHNIMVIGSGFGQQTDPTALIIGPTGLALNHEDLFVADTLYNRISCIPDAILRTRTAYTGMDVTANGLLNGPLGLLFSQNFQIVAANGGDSLLVEISPSGEQISSIDTGAGPGGLFGIALSLNGNAIYFVNNNNNTLQIYS